MHSTQSDIESIDPSLVPLLVSGSMYGLVALLTLLVYDTIITMDKEIKYFWCIYSCGMKSSPCKFVSLIYFASRYLGVLGAISGIVVVTLQANKTLQAYSSDADFGSLPPGILFGLEAAFGLGVLIYIIIYSKISVQRLTEGVTVCFLHRRPKVWGALIWAVAMLYAIILMVLALHKAAQHWRESAGFDSFPELLLAVLGTPSILCVIGSHLLIHLKETGEKRGGGGTSYRMRTMSSMRFT
ncbi:hypothetical protein DFH11DRAFT_1548150 [Phellopilus nigrolimitatus]|nr:hypothetical protein DFH11DRAFT_1548150 [Phellopilus nigrolimitatus]